MAGLYITLEPFDSKKIESIQKYLRHSCEAERCWTGSSGVSYVWSSFDCPDRYAPAHDPVTGVHVITGGRLVYSDSDWARAKALPYEGGLANRLVLAKFLSSGAENITPFNGAACIVVYDPREKCLHLWTDQFGYHPAFIYRTGSELPKVITTFPDAIRADDSLRAELDEVSLAEFLRAWRVTPPHTYYKNLLHAGAASHTTWNFLTKQETKRVYWRPFQGEFYKTVQEAANELSVALKAAVSERTAAAKKVLLFVSGGSDSRVMLFGADNPAKIVGLNMYETKPTNESNVSKALCERVGARYVGRGRDSDYYPRMLDENVRWSGAMWSGEDSHYLGVKSIVDAEQVDLVMTACTTDWVFKGYGMEKQYKMLFGRYLPLKEFFPERQGSFLPNIARQPPAEFADAIYARFDNWFKDCPQQLNEDIDYLRVEDRRIRPACYTVSVSGQMMYRVFPYSTFLADSRVAECYSKTPARMKLNGEVWGQAAALVCKDASDIVDSNFGWSVNANTMQKLVAFSKGWIARRIPKPRKSVASNPSVAKDHPPCYASWPDYGWYAENSPTVQRMWVGASDAVRSRLTQSWGSDPWKQPLEQWARNPLDFFRVLTLLSFLNQLEPQGFGSHAPMHAD